MKKLLWNKTKSSAIPHVAESTVGGSSVVTVVPRFRDARLAELVARHLRSQREDAIRKITDDDDDDDNSHKDDDQDDALRDGVDETPPARCQDAGKHKAPTEKSGECETCGQDTARRCAYLQSRLVL